MIGTLTRRSLGAHKGRSIFIGLAIVLGVAFVSASFILADSLRNTFDELFSGLSEGVDLEVRSSLAFGDDNQGNQRDPVAVELLDQIKAVDGVEAVSPNIFSTATIIGSDGEPVETQGAPQLGTAWDAENTLGGSKIREGRAPVGAGEVMIDGATAKKEKFEIGDTIEIGLDTGRQKFELVGTFGLGDSEGFAGATVAAWDVPTSQQLLGATDGFDAIDIKVADDSKAAEVQQRIEQILPERTEVITGQELADEAKEGVNEFLGYFQNGLLAFAFITLFVSAFIINNVFAITIGQRLRELALMRAIGASGKQVRRLIVVEALVISAIATVIGIAAGFGVSRLIVALFNAAGAGFPPTASIIKPRTIVFALVVGIGVALASVIVPARRAAKIPPVAAMRPELGFVALTSSRRIIGGVVAAGVGATLFLVGIFIGPGGTAGLIGFGAIGALLLFLGVASLSTTFARPVARALGTPIAKLLGTPGRLAKENAARAPRRTAATASALMIGVALVSAAAVFAASLKETFVDTLKSAVTADYIITNESFNGLPTAVAATIATLPEFDAVTAIRGIQAQVGGKDKNLAAMDLNALPKLLDIELREGSIEDAEEGGILLFEDPAKDLGAKLGDIIPVTFINGTTKDLKVTGIYEDNSVAGSWIISINTLEEVSAAAPQDFFVVARLSSTATPADGRAALDALTETYPAMKVQDQAEFRRQQEGQIDQLLAVISILLVFAIVIAVMGIAITLALSVFERTREIGLMRAVGMTRRQTRRMVRWESVIVTVFGGLVGVVLGSLLGIALASAVPESVINTLVVPTGQVIAYLFVAALAGIVAAFYPAAKASRMNVLDAISTT